MRGAKEVLLSTVVLGQPLYGFRHGSRYERNAWDMRPFLGNPYVSLVPVGNTLVMGCDRNRPTASHVAALTASSGTGGKLGRTQEGHAGDLRSCDPSKIPLAFATDHER